MYFSFVPSIYDQSKSVSNICEVASLFNLNELVKFLPWSANWASPDKVYCEALKGCIKFLVASYKLFLAVYI